MQRTSLIAPSHEPLIVNGIDLREWMFLIGICAHKAAKKYHMDAEEFVGTGWLGLKHAAERFDASRGLKFNTYAQSCIESLMISQWERSHPFGQKAVRALRWKKIERIATLRRFSELDDAGEHVDPIDSTVADAGERQYEATLARMLSCLRGRDRYVFLERTVRGRSLVDLGAELGVTRERVRQLETRALNRIREFWPLIKSA